MGRGKEGEADVETDKIDNPYRMGAVIIHTCFVTLQLFTAFVALWSQVFSIHSAIPMGHVSGRDADSVHCPPCHQMDGAVEHLNAKCMEFRIQLLLLLLGN